MEERVGKMDRTSPIAQEHHLSWRTVALLCVLAVMLTLLSYAPYLGWGQDNAEHVLLAESLSTGQGYRALAQPGKPVETKRFPGYPALLAFIQLVAGDPTWHWWKFKSLSMLSYVVSVPLSFWFLKRFLGASDLLTVAACLLVIFNVQVVSLSSAIMAELPFMAVALLALLVCERLAQSNHMPIHFLLPAAALVAASAYLKPQGITLLPAVALYLGMQGRWWRGIAVAIFAGLLLAPWAHHQSRALGQGEHSYFSHSVPQHASFIGRAGAMTERMAHHTLKHLKNLGSVMIARPGDFFSELEDSPNQTVSRETTTDRLVVRRWTAFRIFRRTCTYAIACFALIGAIHTGITRVGLIHIWLALTAVALVGLAPTAPDRYLVPFMPFLSFFFVWGLWVSSTFVLHRFAQISKYVAGAAIILSCILSIIFTLDYVGERFRLKTEYPDEMHDPIEAYAATGNQAFANYMQLSEWAGRNIPSDAVIICRRPEHVYLMSGRSAVIVWESSPSDVWRQISELGRYGPVYLILDSFSSRLPDNLVESAWRPAVKARPDRSILIHKIPDPQTELYRLLMPGDG